jgi:hypothetical protein
MSGFSVKSLLSIPSGSALFAGTIERRSEGLQRPIIFNSVGALGAVGVLGSNIIRRRAHTRKAIDRLFFSREPPKLAESRQPWITMTLLGGRGGLCWH